MEHIDILKTLCKYPAVSGYERDLSFYLKELFGSYCDNVTIDRFFNVVGIMKGNGKNKRKIMISAHIDEIGLMVKGIDDKGFIKFTNIGGIDSKILLAQEVIIHGRKDILGIIGAKPPHLLKADETKKAVKLDELAIDTGMTCDELKNIVSIGDIITIKSETVSLLGSRVSSKALDNRSGVAALIQTMEELKKINFQNDVYFVASVQEEVGLRGIIIAAYNVEPDMAIVIDACHGDMPDIPKDEVYFLGKGPAIGIGPNLHKKATKKLLDIAKDENISYQIDVEPGNTGTEAWATQVSRSGIPTLLISIPVRYMHTPCETLNTDDIKNAGRLTARFLSRLEDGMEEILS